MTLIKINCVGHRRGAEDGEGREVSEREENPSAGKWLLYQLPGKNFSKVLLNLEKAYYDLFE